MQKIWDNKERKRGGKKREIESIWYQSRDKIERGGKSRGRME